MRRIELIEPTLDEQPDPLRHLGLADLEARPPRTVLVEELAGVAEVPEQLLDEERVALRLVDDEVDELRRRRQAGAGRQHLSHLVGREQPRAEVERRPRRAAADRWRS